MLILFFPTFAVLLGVAIAVGAVVGGARSGEKQARSLRESKASGSAELVELDKLRIKAQTLNLVFKLLIGVLVAACFAVGLSGAGTVVTVVCVVVSAAGLLLFWAKLSALRKRFSDSFKENVVRKELEAFLAVEAYEPDSTLDESVVKESRLFPRWDIYSGNDYLSAARGGVKFTQSDIHLQEEREETYTDSDGDTHTRTVYETLFRGRLAVFGYDAISNEPVYVYGRGRKHAAKGEIQTELDSFNQKFRVMAADAVSAFRILTPPVLEGIVSASERLGCPMSLSFLNDKIYIALSNGDAFEASARGDVTLAEQRRRIRAEVQTVLDLIDTIYLKK